MISLWAPLEFPKFAWHHQQTLDTYTIFFEQFSDLLTFSRSLGLILKWLISLALLWRITEKSTLRTTRNCWLWSSASWTALTLRLGWRNAPRPTSKFTTSVTCQQQLLTVYKNVSFFPVSFSLYVFKA